MSGNIKVESPNVSYTDDCIEAEYDYQTTEVRKDDEGTIKVFPRTTRLTMRTCRQVPRVGLMLVGWGGNNGSTVTAAVAANRMGLRWNTKDGQKAANYYGSITQASTVSLGTDQGSGEEVFAPLKDLLPMVEPNDLVIDGWDISSLNLAGAMERAKVLDYDLQRQLKSDLSKLVPRPSVYYRDFIAANQEDRADNVIPGTKQEQLEQIRRDIRDFRSSSGVDKVVVLWTANTERFCAVRASVNADADQLLEAIRTGHSEVAPSTIFAVASILEGCPYINGSPQNTFVPGCLDLAERRGVFVGGDDFKSGQTKFKSVLVDFLVNAGIKPRSIVSYNHLGNNDGLNLSAPPQFRSKEVSKSNVVDDMVAANHILYGKGERPDHCVVIKYVPHVGDSKRAMDEYVSELMLGGASTIAVHNVCEDSLLAAPIIVDLVVLAELCQRISFKVEGSAEFQPFHPVLSLLSYLCKAPLVPPGAAVVNALSRQRASLENVLRACLGLAPLSHMALEQRMSAPEQWDRARTAARAAKRERQVMNGGGDGGHGKKTKVMKREEAENGVCNGHHANGVDAANGC